MTVEECKALMGPDLSQWANVAVTMFVGLVGAYFIFKQNKILIEQSKIFEKQNEFNNRLIEIQNRMDKKERLINRVHYAGMAETDLNIAVQALLDEGIHYSEIAGAFHSMGIPTGVSTPGTKTLRRIEEAFKSGRSKRGTNS